MILALSGSYLLLVRLFALGVLRGSLLETSLLLLLGLGTILVGKLEELSGSILVERVRELGDCWRDFQALVEDDLLTLEANVLGPLDEASQILLRLDILAWIRERSAIIPPCRLSVSKAGGLLDGRYPPMPKFLGVASKSGFWVFFWVLEAPKGAGAGFLPDLALGGWWTGH